MAVIKTTYNHDVVYDCNCNQGTGKHNKWSLGEKDAIIPKTTLQEKSEGQVCEWCEQVITIHSYVRTPIEYYLENGVEKKRLLSEVVL